jgi:hypothetical protein
MSLPTITLAVLARDMAFCLDDYLSCISALQYPKELIRIRVRTNDNFDDTERVLEAWVEQAFKDYMSIEVDAASMGVTSAPGHHWDEANLSRIARVREESLSRFRDQPTDYYLSCDCDNFLTNPRTLLELVLRDQPIAAPMLDVLPATGSLYSNFFSAVDDRGYYVDTPAYAPIRCREVRGSITVPVVHCTYLVRREVILERKVTYLDDTGRHEFVVFAESARKSGAKQVLLNEHPYGFLLHGLAERPEDEALAYVERCRPTVLKALEEARR